MLTGRQNKIFLQRYRWAILKDFVQLFWTKFVVWLIIKFVGQLFGHQQSRLGNYDYGVGFVFSRCDLWENFQENSLKGLSVKEDNYIRG